MDEDALLALGTVFAALGGMLERHGICTTYELAETLGGVAHMTLEAGEEYRGRAAYIGSWAHIVRTAALGAGKSNQH